MISETARNRPNVTSSHKEAPAGADKTSAMMMPLLDLGRLNGPPDRLCCFVLCRSAALPVTMAKLGQGGPDRLNPFLACSGYVCMSPDGRLREVVRFACRVCPRVGRYRLAVLAVLHSRLKPRFWTGQTVRLPACLGPPLPLQLRARGRGDIAVRDSPARHCWPGRPAQRSCGRRDCG